MTLAHGTRLGAYEIVALIGSGGMGEVYRARDGRLGREVAVKVLPAAVAARPDALARFEREARAVAALSHPNILAIHDVGGADGVAFAVTELLAGQTLRDALADGPLPVRRALEWAAAIARGLAAAHDKGIVHRDLKPENVFITADNQIKILDFGLARQDATLPAAAATIAMTANSPTDPGIVLGTVGYMAPEQVRGEVADYRADQFALGAVVYEMITGRRAFLKETAAETMTAILREDPAEDPRAAPLPASVDRIVRHCLEKKPEARFRSTHDLAFALDALAGATASGGARAAEAPVVVRPAPRWRAAAAALALVAAGAAAGWTLAARRTAPGASVEPPVFRQVTFSHGQVFGARFAPDGRTIVYSTGRTTKRLYLSRLESPGATPLPIEGMRLLAVSANAELALDEVPPDSSLVSPGVLAQAPMIGGTPRPVLPGVSFADWSPRGDALAIVRVAGSRQRLEFPIGTVLYETDGEIGYPRVAPSGDRLAFIDWPVRDDDRGTVAIVDLHGARTTIAKAREGIRGLAWDPDGTQVWYTATDVGTRYAVWTTAPGRAERRVYSAPTGVILEDISRDGRALLTQYGRASQIYTWSDGEAAERGIAQVDYSFARDISPDGTRVLLSTSGEGSSANYDVYIAARDGTSLTKIGEGQAQQLSPDGRSALAIAFGPPVRVMILPLGPGQPRVVATGDVSPRYARWLPDGRRLLVVGSQPDRRARAFVVDLEGSAPRPVSPEGISLLPDRLALSPDGTRVALRSAEGPVMLYPLAAGPAVPVKGLKADEMPSGWTRDGRYLTLQDPPDGMRLLKLDPETGVRSLLLELKHSDASMDSVRHIMVSADGRAYAANYQHAQGTLFVAEGLIPGK